MVRVSYPGRATAGNSYFYGGDPIRLTAGTSGFEGTVLGVDQSGTTIPRRTVPIVLAADVSPSVAGAVEPGDRAAVAGTEVARVTRVDRADATGDRVGLHVGAGVTAIDRDPVPVFGGRGLRVGARVAILTDDVVLTGEVAAAGTDGSPES